MPWRSTTPWGPPPYAAVPGSGGRSSNLFIATTARFLHDHDKFAFFSSEGKVAEFFNDLIEAGFDAIYTAVPTVDLEQLAKECRRRVTFWLDPGVERLSPPCTHDDVREDVRRVRRLMDFGSGVIARCAVGPRHAASQRDRLLRGVDDSPARRGVRGANSEFGSRNSEGACAGLLRIPTSEFLSGPGPLAADNRARRSGLESVPLFLGHDPNRRLHLPQRGGSRKRYPVGGGVFGVKALLAPPGCFC